MSQFLPEDHVSKQEESHFGQETVENLDYLKLRNFILKLFLENPTNELTLEAAKTELSQIFDSKLIESVYNFLHSASYINFGIIDVQMEDVEDTSDGIIILGSGLSGLACARQLGNLGHKVTLVDMQATKEHCVWTSSDAKGFAVLCKQAGTDLAELTFNLDGVKLYQGMTEILESDSSSNSILEFILQVIRVFLDQSDGAEVEELRTELGYDDPKEPILALSEEERAKMTIGDLFERALTSFNIQLDENASNELLWRFALLELRLGGSLSQIQGSIQAEKPTSFHFAKDGFTQVFTKLMETLPKTVERISAKLEDMKIQWSPEAKTVEVAIGKQTHKGTALVFAHPISTLKQTLGRFEPPLPEWKSKAVEALGSGAIAHCVMQFSTQFWGETPAFGVVGSKIVAPDEIQKLANASDPERGANFLFLNLTSVYDKPTLLCLHSGQAAQAAELPSIESTMKTLKTIFGEDIPEPENARLENLSFPILAPKSSAEDIDALSKSVDDVLFFTRGERGPSGRFFNGVSIARQVHQNREPARKRKASETFEEPPSKKQAVEVEDTGSFDPLASIDPITIAPPKPQVKKMKVNVKTINIATNVDMKQIRDANTAKVVKMSKEKMDDQKSKLMNGMFQLQKKPKKQKRPSGSMMQTITVSIPAASPPRPTLPSPSLPSIDAVTFSEDEEQASDLPKAPTPKKAKQNAKAAKKAQKSSEKKSKKEKFKEVMKRIQSYVKKAMGQCKNASKLKTDDRKKIVKKAANKVFDEYREKVKKGKSVKWEEFMQSKRKAAIKQLVKRYVKNFS